MERKLKVDFSRRIFGQDGRRDQIVFRDGDEVRYLTGRVSSTAAAIEMGQTAATWID